MIDIDTSNDVHTEGITTTMVPTRYEVGATESGTVFEVLHIGQRGDDAAVGCLCTERSQAEHC